MGEDKIPRDRPQDSSFIRNPPTTAAGAVPSKRASNSSVGFRKGLTGVYRSVENLQQLQREQQGLRELLVLAGEVVPSGVVATQPTK